MRSASSSRISRPSTAGAGAAVLRPQPDPALARLLPQPARCLSGRLLPVAPRVGRVLRGGRIQQRRPGARWGRDQAVPHPLVDSGLALSDRLRRPSSWSRCSTPAVGVFVLIFAFTQGVFPKPPDFSKLDSFDISYLAEHFRLTLFLITAARRCSRCSPSRCCRAASWPSGRAFARGSRCSATDRATCAKVRLAAGRRMDVPLRRVLVPAGRVPRGRVG